MATLYVCHYVSVKCIPGSNAIVSIQICDVNPYTVVDVTCCTIVELYNTYVTRSNKIVGVIYGIVLEH